MSRARYIREISLHPVVAYSSVSAWPFLLRPPHETRLFVLLRASKAANPAFGAIPPNVGTGAYSVRRSNQLRVVSTILNALTLSLSGFLSCIISRSHVVTTQNSLRV